MKKTVLIALASFLVICITSCIKDEEQSFDEGLLYGKWQSGTLHYRYDTDHTGVTWDLADDVMENEGKKFSWSLINEEFTHIYVTEINAYGTKASIPKVYTVIVLTATRLEYEDDFGKTFSFTKVK